MEEHSKDDLQRQVQAHEELLIALVMLVHKVNPAAFKELQRIFTDRRARTTNVEGFPDPLQRAEEIVAVASKLEMI